MHPERIRVVQLKFLLSDLLVLGLGFLLFATVAESFSAEPHRAASNGWLFWVATPTLSIFFGLLGRYRVEGVSEQDSSTVVVLAQGMVLAFGTVSTVVFSLDVSRTSLAFFAAVLGLAFPPLVLTRTLLWPILLRQEQRERRRVMIVGSRDKALDVAALASREPGVRTHCVGFLALEPGRDEVWRDLPVLGSLEQAESVLFRDRVDEILIAVPDDKLKVIGPLLLLCDRRGITARLACDFLVPTEAKPYLERLGGIPILTFAATSKNAELLALKRVVDVVLGSVLLALSLPVLALAALSIKLTSRGPVLYRQLRCGLDGRPFVFLKLRTMVDGADERRSELAHLNEAEPPIFKISADPRVTRVGRILRRTSIDELPQLVNVLRGEMSLVGPRPPLPQEVEQYDGWQRRRLSVKPGITCLWQVSGRSALGFQRWVELDLEYIDRWSLWLDFKIVLRTAVAVVSLKGAW